MHQLSITVPTNTREFKNITTDIQDAIREYAPETGLCHLFIQHTSASLLIAENADSQVLIDLENYMARLVKDGDKLFKHCDEGDDDMPAHIRTILTETSLMIPIQNHRLALGVWQGVYLWEHRTSKHYRKILISII